MKGGKTTSKKREKNIMHLQDAIDAYDVVDEESREHALGMLKTVNSIRAVALAFSARVANTVWELESHDNDSEQRAIADALLDAVLAANDSLDALSIERAA